MQRGNQPRAPTTQTRHPWDAMVQRGPSGDHLSGATGSRLHFLNFHTRRVRPLSVIAAPRSPKVCPRLQLADAWPDLATKASEPSRDASYRPSYLSWQGVGKSAAVSEQLATWFTGWVCHADVIQAVAVFSALREKTDGKLTMSHLGRCPLSLNGPGEPSGGTRDPGGGLSGRRTAPTAWTVPTRKPRGG